MPKIEFTLRTVSPLFLNGGNSRQPDLLRASSVRGQLRYWYRAIKGASIGSLGDLFRAEARVFGTTDAGSPVTIRMWSEKEAKSERTAMLPHKTQDDEKSYMQAYPEALDNLHLQFITRPGVDFNTDFLKALVTWQWLGGLGKRSRRAFGALQHYRWAKSDIGKLSQNSTNGLAPSVWWDLKFHQMSAKSYASLLEKHFQWVFKDVQFLQHPVTNFPTLHPSTSRVIVCQQSQESAEEANRSAFGLIRSKKYAQFKNSGAFGYARGPNRLASPLHVQVRQLGGQKCHLIFTAMANALDRENHEVLRDFMKDAIAEFDGVTVWGEL